MFESLNNLDKVELVMLPPACHGEQVTLSVFALVGRSGRRGFFINYTESMTWMR